MISGSSNEEQRSTGCFASFGRKVKNFLVWGLPITMALAFFPELVLNVSLSLKYMVLGTQVGIINTCLAGLCTLLIVYLLVIVYAVNKAAKKMNYLKTHNCMEEYLAETPAIKKNSISTMLKLHFNNDTSRYLEKFGHVHEDYVKKSSW